MGRVTKLDLEKQVFDLKQLLEISKSLNSTLDYNILIDSILYTCMGQLKVVKAGILTRKTLDSADLVLYRNYVGFEIHHDKDYLVPHDHPLMKQISQEIRCYHPKELAPFIHGNPSVQNIFDLNPVIMVPLKAKGITHGLLILGDRISEEEFSEHEVDFLINISMFAAIAIHNAFLFEMTTTDMMTKLKMKHFFLTALMEKQQEARQEGEHLSLIMMDIDNFKILNDTYGHTRGDEVLIEVARIIQRNVRQVDIAARYGGEEFVALLPGANLATSKQVAERIRLEVEKTVIQSDGEELAVTLSLGVAEYDSRRDTNGINFIDRADKALYYSKQHGRNQVTLAT